MNNASEKDIIQTFAQDRIAMRHEIMKAVVELEYVSATARNKAVAAHVNKVVVMLRDAVGEGPKQDPLDQIRKMVATVRAAPTLEI